MHARGCCTTTTTQDEVLELQELYASSRTPQPAARVVVAMAERKQKWASSTSNGHGVSAAPAHVTSIIGQINNRGVKYGAGLEVLSSAGRVSDGPSPLLPSAASTQQ